MRLVVATDKWRGAFSSREAGAALASGVRGAAPDAEVSVVEVADGGEGTLDAVLARVAGERRRACVADPLGRAVEAPWAVLADGTALIESAAAIGHALLAPGERDPLRASSRGVGELVRAALDGGCERLWLALGGSVTVDGGAGFAQALGFRLLDRRGREIDPGGGALVEVAAIDSAARDSRLAGLRVDAWCDVGNPLVGERGAARVFGPQKGAGPEAVERLEEGLARFGAVIQRELGVRVLDVESAGAAGGLGAAALAFAGARLELGATCVLDAISFEPLVTGVDLVVTGEGRFDGSTMPGKLPLVVATRAAKLGIPTILACGEDVSGGTGHGAVVHVLSGSDLKRASGARLSAVDLAALGALAVDLVRQRAAARR
ncbi:MAG: glycerate kinase [bacterium]